jgi:signal transduction histidine kinase
MNPEPSSALSVRALEPADRAPMLARLREHKTLQQVPDAELTWLIDHGSITTYGVGDLIWLRTTPIDSLHIVLAGHIAIFVDRGGGRRKVMEWHGGDVTGLLPYSRLTIPPGDTVVVEPTEGLTVHKEHFPEMIRECPVLTATLVHLMLDRARLFNASDLHDEKMVSLGRLAAGLAHELNNPASAAARSAKLLGDELREADSAARALGALALSDEQRRAIERVRDLCLDAPPQSIRSPLEQADREEQIEEWLADHDADVAAAGPLAATAVSADALDQLARIVEGEHLNVALRWIATGCATRALASDIEKASTRVHHLVSAVKGFTYMDRASVPEAVDLGRGLADTVAVLAAKARDKSVAVALRVEPDLPPVRGFGGELNQVWANLIDNALDAVSESGHVEVGARREPGWVVVTVVDDGGGIPPEVNAHIFDPFFTTKPVGHGTGLGLDIARRLVRRHGGEIVVASRPGRTEFRVSLPADTPVAGAMTSTEAPR